MITRFYIALFTPGGRPNELHIITPGHLALIHSLHHLPSLLGSMLPIFLLKINWTYFGRWAVSPLLITWAWIPQVSWKWGLSVHSHAPAVNKIDTTHQTFAYQIKVTGQTTTSHVQIVTGILRISAKHKVPCIISYLNNSLKFVNQFMHTIEELSSLPSKTFGSSCWANDLR